jgi:hypothetical protein
MPAPLARSKQTFPELLEGNGQIQTIGLRDALMNYNQLLEREGKLAYEPPGGAAPPAEDAAAGEEASANEADTATENERAQAEQVQPEQAGE